MKTETESSAPRVDPAVLLAGGVELDVHLFSGEQKRVKVRLLKIGELPHLLTLCDDYERLAEYVVEGAVAGWAETLSAESILEIAEKGLDLNFATARRWAELRARHGKLAAAFVKPLLPNPLPPGSANSARTSAS